MIIFAGLICACNSTDSKSNKSSASRLLPEPDIIDRLKYQKQIIDTLINLNKDKLIVLAKLTNNSVPIIINNGNFPDNVDITYNIFKDSLGHILTISELPFSESGDWNIILTHYFDNTGKTFAFERQSIFFNSICTDGVAYESKTDFYDRDFKLIDKMYILADEKNKPLQRDNCQFPYDFKYNVSADINRYLQMNRIKNSR